MWKVVGTEWETYKVIKKIPPGVTFILYIAVTTANHSF